MNLHPRSIPVRALENAGRIAFFVVVGIVTSSGDGPPPIPLLVGLTALGVVVVLSWEAAYVRWFSYELTPDTFDIHSGVLSRREREIPYERIQNVDISQNPLQRILGVAEVRIETAGGSGTEATLKYVSKDESQRLQDDLSERKRASGTERPAGETLFTLSRRELGVLALVSADPRVLGLLSVVLSAFAPALADRLQPGPDLVSLAGPLIALVGILLLWGVSAGMSLLRYWGFQLRREGEELRYERGLLQRFSGTIPSEKIQTLRLRENALARALGYASLAIETAGYGADRDGGVQSAVPLARRERALTLAREIEPIGDLDFQRPPGRARMRYAARYGLVVVALIAVLWAGDAFTPWEGPWYLAVGLLAVVPVAAHLSWVHRGYHVGEEYLVTRNGFWRRETVVVPYDRVQTVASSQSVFQRRRDLGSVRVDTASTASVFGTQPLAADVDSEVAEDLRESVHRRFQDAIERV